MTFIVADRVQETTTTTGTGTLTLAGAAAQFQSFSAGIGANNVTYYGLLDGNGTAWETGIGTVGGGGTTLARTTVLESSNSNAAISLSSGTHTVYCNQPARAIQNKNFNGSIYNVPPSTAFTFVNQGSATLTSNTNGPLVWQQTVDPGSDLLSFSQLATSGSFTATINFSAVLDNRAQASFGITDGTAAVFMGLQLNNSGSFINTPTIFVQHWNSTTSPSGAGNFYLNEIAFPMPIWMQIVYNSATPSIHYNWSTDGFTWVTVWTESGSLFLTPTDVWIGCDPHNINSGTPPTISVNYLVVA